MIDSLIFDMPHACMVQAAQANAVPVALLYALRHKENGRIGFKNVHTFSSGKSTVDYGPFQTNDFWVRYFQRNYGISGEQIAAQPCVAAGVTAYIVRYEINRAGGDFWTAVGRYHSPTPDRARRYVADVAPLAERYRVALQARYGVPRLAAN